MGDGRRRPFAGGLTVLARMAALVGLVAACGDGTEDGAGSPAETATTAVTAPVPTTTSPPVSTVPPTTTSQPVSTVPSPTTAPVSGAQDRGAWVLATAPAGFQPVLAQDGGGRRSVFYQRHDAIEHIYDAPIRVTVTEVPPFDIAMMPGARPVGINGRAGVAFTLYSDGSDFGSAVTFPDEHGRTVIVEWAELGPDVLELARAAVPVSAGEWQRLRRALSIETRIGRPEPDAIEVVLMDERVDDVTYRLVALVPAGYPMGEPDLRRTCYRVDLAGMPGTARCDAHPWWECAGGHAFVYGPAGAGVEAVTVRPTDPNGAVRAGEPVRATVVKPDSGPPGGLYLAVVPGDWCTVVVEADDGGPAPGLGPIGPLPGHPDYAACLASG